MKRELVRLGAILSAAALFTTVLAGSEWKIDPAHSAAQFSVRHMMVATVRGQFDKMSGTVAYDPAAPEKSSVRVEVEAGSINTRNEKRDEHLRSDDFFSAAKFPVLRFESTRVVASGGGRLALAGNLTIRDVTKEVVFEVEGLAEPIKDPRGNLRSGATATAKINRKDFGLTWNRMLEAGGVTVGDEVTIIVDIAMVSAGS